MAVGMQRHTTTAANRYRRKMHDTISSSKAPSAPRVAGMIQLKSETRGAGNVSGTIDVDLGFLDAWAEGKQTKGCCT